MVQPEGHPGDTDRHEGGDVDGEDIVRQLSLELHVDREAAVDARGGLDVTLAKFTKNISSSSGRDFNINIGFYLYYLHN